MTGVSRSFTHELIRHRHFSYSQLSQRYVDESDSDFVEPDVIASDPALHAEWVGAVESARRAYDRLVAGLQERFSAVPDKTLRRKLARHAGRPHRPSGHLSRTVADPQVAWRPVTRVAGERRALDQDAVAVERALEIRLGGRSLSVTLRTPGHDEELAVGFLAGEGLIARAA